MAIRSLSWVCQARRSSTLRCKSAKNDSMAALSPAEPTWPIGPAMRRRVNARCSFRERNCDPLSELSRNRLNSDYVEVWAKPRIREAGLVKRGWSAGSSA